jgi:hypothetical protein
MFGQSTAAIASDLVRARRSSEIDGSACCSWVWIAALTGKCGRLTAQPRQRLGLGKRLLVVGHRRPPVRSGSRSHIWMPSRRGASSARPPRSARTIARVTNSRGFARGRKLERSSWLISMSLRLRRTIARSKHRAAYLCVEKEAQFAPATSGPEQRAKPPPRLRRRRK